MNRLRLITSFQKAGKEGWEAIIPIYDLIVLLEITNLPIWYLVLLCIPMVNVIIAILIYIDLAKKFGQSTLFGLGIYFLKPIFLAILAFGDDYVYEGGNAITQNTDNNINNFFINIFTHPFI